MLLEDWYIEPIFFFFRNLIELFALIESNCSEVQLFEIMFTGNWKSWLITSAINAFCCSQFPAHVTNTRSKNLKIKSMLNITSTQTMRQADSLSIFAFYQNKIWRGDLVVDWSCIHDTWVWKNCVGSWSRFNSKRAESERLDWHFTCAWNIIIWSIYSRFHATLISQLGFIYSSIE